MRLTRPCPPTCRIAQTTRLSLSPAVSNRRSSLIARARAGDELAVERLFQLHFHPLRRWASGRLPKWARDVWPTRTTLSRRPCIQTFKRIEEFEPRRVGALQAYLRQAVLNRIRDELRQKGRAPEAGELDDVEADSAAVAARTGDRA